MGLKWAQVDLQKQRLLVQSSLVVTAHGLALEPPKTASGQRVVELDGGTVALLRAHRTRQLELARQLGEDPPEIVFPREGSEEWCHPNTLSHAVVRMAKKAGCPQVTLRSLRHFHATVALQAGKNLAVVSKRLGHAKVSITADTYAHVLPRWQRETADAFANEMSSGA